MIGGMNSPKPIGGYFELELPEGDFPHSSAILLNNGRACLEYVLRANKVDHIHVPKLTCSSVVEPMDKLGVSYSFYSINEYLEVELPFTLHENHYMIINNYFGLKNEYCRCMGERFGRQLIIDCSQAFFAEPIPKCHSFYTPRKFFGVPDGGCLYTDKLLDVELEADRSHERFSHLIKRIDLGAEQGYADFQRNEATIGNQPMKAMSHLTRRMLGSFDYEQARCRRAANFDFLHDALQCQNRFALLRASDAYPMVYPFLSHNVELRRKLIEHKVFVATYWPNVFQWCGPEETEYRLACNVLPLPIDQRYGLEDMERIVGLLK
jgi:hypothetical protein